MKGEYALLQDLYSARNRPEKPVMLDRQSGLLPTAKAYLGLQKPEYMGASSISKLVEYTNNGLTNTERGITSMQSPAERKLYNLLYITQTEMAHHATDN